MFPEDLNEEEQQARVRSTLTKTADQLEWVGRTVACLIENPMLSGCCIPLDGGRNVAHEHHYRKLAK